MMTFQVRMLAFGNPDEVRPVDVSIDALPDLADNKQLYGLLEEIYRLGQNDFQSKPHPSVSVGDVIELEDRFFVVRTMGHVELTKEQVAELTAVPQNDRDFHELVRPRD